MPLPVDFYNLEEVSRFANRRAQREGTDFWVIEGPYGFKIVDPERIKPGEAIYHKAVYKPDY